jgi:hypothetical protein
VSDPSSNSDRAARSATRGQDRARPAVAPRDVGFWEVLAFCCELGMVIAFAMIGWQVGPSLSVRILLALVLPGMATGVWAVWMAPNSSHRLADPARSMAEIFIFGASAAALTLAGHQGWGVGLFVISALDIAVVAWLRAPA